MAGGIDSRSSDILMKTFHIIAFTAGVLGLALPAPGATIVYQLGTATAAQISPTTIRFPYGAPGYYPTLDVGGSNSAVIERTRLVLEFALPNVSNPADITTATLGLKTFGGSSGQGQLEYRIFGYAGTGSLGLDTGAAGLELAGPYYYRINFSVPPNLSAINVTEFVRSMVAAGATHAGFSVRDTNTPAGFYTDRQSIVVQDSPSWAGDVPPVLTVEVVPEPSSYSLACMAAATLLLRRRRSPCGPE